ncbi:MAG: hypothetical protein PHF99_01310 [Bacteroidales bacterium]|nr:hypothetical protein [Bacteroidales bacterium]MDD4234632.1 hypothetical protein [Bacteroidales bacterium]
MSTVKINFVDALKTSIAWGLKNLPSIIGAVILWALTCWIPYLNIGTTIALITIPIEISKGKVISPTFIFDSKYRRYMGEFFLLNGLRFQGIAIGFAMFIIPGIVINLAWSLSNYLLIDKEKNPMDALAESNKATNGNKAAMFLSNLAIMIIIIIFVWIFGYLGVVGNILTFLLLIAVSPILFSLKAYFYKTLVLDAEVAVQE